MRQWQRLATSRRDVPRYGRRVPLRLGQDDVASDLRHQLLSDGVQLAISELLPGQGCLAARKHREVVHPRAGLQWQPVLRSPLLLHVFTQCLRERQAILALGKLPCYSFGMQAGLFLSWPQSTPSRASAWMPAASAQAAASLI